MTPPIGTSIYQWTQVYHDRKQNHADHLDEILAQVACAGLVGWEPFIGPPDETSKLATLLEKHHLQAPAAYANLELHTVEWRKHADNCLAQVRHMAPLGTRLVDINPVPIRWHGPENKNDEELDRQAGALRYLSTELQRFGMNLAYHTHDPEMRCGAREFHHMMLATAEVGMTLCLDSHWIYRGTGDSNIALRDIVSMYASRISMLHLRQSHHGVWCELLEPGDVDYVTVLAMLKKAGFHGPMNLEIAQEKGTQRTMPLEEAHRLSAEWLRSTWDAA